jgi:type II secretory pathway component PulF
MIAYGKIWQRRDVILLLERLELYIAAGLQVDRALALSAEGISKRHRSSLLSALSAVESGGSLSRALSRSIAISPTLAGLIGHGETSGGLREALSAAKAVLEREDEMLRKCTAALAYPLVIALFAGALTVGLVRGVMPQIIPLLKSLHVPLPLLTRSVIFVSENILSKGAYAALGLVLAFALLRIAYIKRERFRRISQSVAVRLPIVGGLIRRYALAVFLRSCGAMIGSGLSVGESYRNTASAVSLLPMRSDLLACAGEIDRGVPLGTALSLKNIPRYVRPLALAGEATGSLGPSLVRSADIIDRDIEHELKRLSSLIEPVMMVAMGCVVGAIALSIMLPIYDISKVLQK